MFLFAHAKATATEAAGPQWDKKVPDTEGGANRRFLGH